MPDRAARLTALVGAGTLLTGALLALTGPVGTGSASVPLAPRAGQYAGHEAAKPSPLPVSFTVAANRARVRGFTAEAEVKAGCPNHITEFQAPSGPMAISSGRFTAVSRAYPQKGVVVRVTGRFTSATTAVGHITIRLTKVKGCNASRAFAAKRTT